MQLFKHTPKPENVRYTPEGRAFELTKEQKLSLERTPSVEEAAAAGSTAEAAGHVAITGAEQAGDNVHPIDPSHEIAAHASDSDPNQAA